MIDKQKNQEQKKEKDPNDKYYLTQEEFLNKVIYFSLINLAGEYAQKFQPQEINKYKLYISDQKKKGEKYSAIKSSLKVAENQYSRQATQLENMVSGFESTIDEESIKYFDQVNLFLKDLVERGAGAQIKGGNIIRVIDMYNMGMLDKTIELINEHMVQIAEEEHIEEDK